MKKTFIKGNKKRVTFDEMVTEIKKFNLEKPNHKIIIGCDSQRIRNRFCFAIAIAVVDPGNGGRYYIKKEVKKPHRKMSIKSMIAWKVWEEAQMICAMFSDLLNAGIDLDEKVTHHDLSMAGLSREHVDSIKGFMISMGFSPEIKPNAIIASGLANIHSKRI